MDLTLLAGSANPPLAQAVALALGQQLGAIVVHRFPDGELHIEIGESVRDHDVYVIQPTSPPVGEHLLELMLVVDACRRAGAGRVTAVIPYFGYARQDRRATGREPVSARLVTNLLQTCGLDRVVTVDLHTSSLEGFFAIPLEHLSAVSLLTETARSMVDSHSVVVSPDLGAVKLAERYATRLGLPVAIVHKTRLSGAEVRAERIIGEVRDRAPLVIDDMISTGGTIEAAGRALVAAGARPEITVVTTHALLVGPAVDRLSALPLRRLIATDSVVAQAEPPFIIEVAGLGPLLAKAIERISRGHSLGDLVAHG